MQNITVLNQSSKSMQHKNNPNIDQQTHAIKILDNHTTQCMEQVQKASKALMCQKLCFQRSLSGYKYIFFIHLNHKDAVTLSKEFHYSLEVCQQTASSGTTLSSRRNSICVFLLHFLVVVSRLLFLSVLFCFPPALQTNIWNFIRLLVGFSSCANCQLCQTPVYWLALFYLLFIGCCLEGGHCQNNFGVILWHP